MVLYSTKYNNIGKYYILRVYAITYMWYNNMLVKILPV